MRSSRSINQVSGKIRLIEVECPPPDPVLHVGAGGWDYLNTEGDRLKAYSMFFNFVEVNTTFYHMPRLSTVRSWRRRVPRDFTFSVKCHRRATHELCLRPQEGTYRVLDQMREVLSLLRADMLVLQTPPSLHVDETKVCETDAVLRSTAVANVQIFWESRSLLSPCQAWKTRQAMLRVGVTPVVDLAQEEPVPGSKVIYSRLFESTRFSDSLLDSVGSKLRIGGSEVAILAFHGSAMYRDAARFNELRGLRLCNTAPPSLLQLC